jgi:hypothetical protein
MMSLFGIIQQIIIIVINYKYKRKYLKTDNKIIYMKSRVKNIE